MSDAADRARDLFAGRVIWNVNSTSRGGGVAEMLVSLLAYARGAGVNARWEVISGNPDFFALTKRIHNHLHGAPGDGGDAGRRRERGIYAAALEPERRQLTGWCRPSDVVIVHDPQPAGLVGPLVDMGVPVIWRCHVGLDAPNELTRKAWSFLRPYVAKADALVFSRKAFVWEDLTRRPDLDHRARRSTRSRPRTRSSRPENVKAILERRRARRGRPRAATPCSRASTAARRAWPPGRSSGGRRRCPTTTATCSRSRAGTG